MTLAVRKPGDPLGIHRTHDVDAATRAKRLFTARHSGWFALEGGLAAAAVALVASQVAFYLTSNGLHGPGDLTLATSVVLAAVVGAMALLIGLVTWFEVDRRTLSPRGLGRAVLVRMAVGTSAAGIAASGLLGSWQVWLMTSSVAVVSAVAGGLFAAWCVRREAARRAAAG